MACSIAAGTSAKLAEEWDVADKAMESVFNLTFSLLNLSEFSKVNDVANQIWERYKSLEELVSGKVAKSKSAPVRKQLKRKRKKKGEDEVLDKDENAANVDLRTTSGFVVGQRENQLLILTCAHAVEEIYGNGIHTVTPYDINTFYEIQVLCRHEEKRILAELGDNLLEEQPRWWGVAECIGIDTRKDLMLVAVDMDKIYCGDGADEESALTCPMSHPILKVTDNPPLKSLEPCILLGWPPQKLGCLGRSFISYSNRTYDSVTQSNPKNYTMRLTEFTSMAAEEGCSGGAVVRLARNTCVGVYHGIMGQRGYAISAADVIDFFKIKQYDAGEH